MSGNNNPHLFRNLYSQDSDSFNTRPNHRSSAPATVVSGESENRQGQGMEIIDRRQADLGGTGQRNTQSINSRQGDLGRNNGQQGTQDVNIRQGGQIGPVLGQHYNQSGQLVQTIVEPGRQIVRPSQFGYMPPLRAAEESNIRASVPPVPPRNQSSLPRGPIYDEPIGNSSPLFQHSSIEGESGYDRDMRYVPAEPDYREHLQNRRSMPIEQSTSQGTPTSSREYTPTSRNLGEMLSPVGNTNSSRGTPHSFRDGTPHSFRDGTPHSFRDGTPHSFRNVTAQRPQDDGYGFVQSPGNVLSPMSEYSRGQGRYHPYGQESPRLNDSESSLERMRTLSREKVPNKKVPNKKGLKGGPQDKEVKFVDILIRPGTLEEVLKIDYSGRKTSRFGPVDPGMPVKVLNDLLHGTFDTPETKISEYYFYIGASDTAICVWDEPTLKTKIHPIPSHVDVGAVERGPFKKTTWSVDTNARFLLVLKIDKTIEPISPAIGNNPGAEKMEIWDSSSSEEEDNINKTKTPIKIDSEETRDSCGPKREDDVDSVITTSTIKIEPEDKFLPSFHKTDGLDHECIFDPEIIEALTKSLGEKGDKRLEIERNNTLASLIENYIRVCGEEGKEEVFYFKIKNEDGSDFGGIRREAGNTIINAAIQGRIISEPEPHGSCILPISRNIESIEALFFYLSKLAMAGVLVPVMNPLTLACIFNKNLPTSPGMWVDALLKFPQACGKNSVNDMIYVLNHKIVEGVIDQQVVAVKLLLHENGDIEPINEENKMEKIGELFKIEMLINQSCFLVAARKGIEKAGFDKIMKEHPAFGHALSWEVKPFLVVTKEEVVGKLVNSSPDMLEFDEEEAKQQLVKVLEELSQDGGAFHESSGRRFGVRDFVKYVTAGFDMLTVPRILIDFTDNYRNYFFASTCSQSITLPRNLDYEKFREGIMSQIAWGGEGFSFA